MTTSDLAICADRELSVYLQGSVIYCTMDFQSVAQSIPTDCKSMVLKGTHLVLAIDHLKVAFERFVEAAEVIAGNEDCR